MSNLYSSTIAARPSGEKNDCAVVALSIFLEVPYAEAHKVLAENGRKPRKGTKRETTEKAILALRPNAKIKKYFVKEARTHSLEHRDGYRPIEEIKGKYPRLYKTKNFTIKHLEWFGETWSDIDNALIFVNRHVAAFRNGKVEDWSKGKRKHIQEIWLIEDERDASDDVYPSFNI